MGCDFTPRIHKEILEAQNMIREQRHEEAAELYKRILKGSLTPDIKAKILFQLGRLYSLHFGKYYDAVEYLKKAKDVAEDPSLLVKSEENIADIYFSFIKDYESSVVSYKKLADFKPHLPKYKFYEYRLAQSYSKSSRYPEAKNILNRIIKESEHPYRAKAIFALALIHFHAKEYLRAVKKWKEYIKVEKRRDNIIQAKFLMANSYETMEDLKRAYNIYYSILGEYPNTKVVRDRLDSIYHRRVARKR